MNNGAGHAIDAVVVFLVLEYVQHVGQQWLTFADAQNFFSIAFVAAHAARHVQLDERYAASVAHVAHEVRVLMENGLGLVGQMAQDVFRTPARRMRKHARSAGSHFRQHFDVAVQHLAPNQGLLFRLSSCRLHMALVDARSCLQEAGWARHRIPQMRTRVIVLRALAQRPLLHVQQVLDDVVNEVHNPGLFAELDAQRFLLLLLRGEADALFELWCCPGASRAPGAAVPVAVALHNLKEVQFHALLSLSVADLNAALECVKDNSSPSSYRLPLENPGDALFRDTVRHHLHGVFEQRPGQETAPAMPVSLLAFTALRCLDPRLVRHLLQTPAFIFLAGERRRLPQVFVGLCDVPLAHNDRNSCHFVKYATAICGGTLPLIVDLSPFCKLRDISFPPCHATALGLLLQLTIGLLAAAFPSAFTADRPLVVACAPAAQALSLARNVDSARLIIPSRHRALAAGFNLNAVVLRHPTVAKLLLFQKRPHDYVFFFAKSRAAARGSSTATAADVQAGLALARNVHDASKAKLLKAETRDVNKVPFCSLIVYAAREPAHVPAFDEQDSKLLLRGCCKMIH